MPTLADAIQVEAIMFVAQTKVSKASKVTFSFPGIFTEKLTDLQDLDCPETNMIVCHLSALSGI
jgi:hypothetical protein